MKEADLQSVVALFESHLQTIDLALYLVGIILAVLSIVTWKGIKSAIANRVLEEVKSIAEKERDKIKEFITAEVSRIAQEEGNALYKDLELHHPDKIKETL